MRADNLISSSPNEIETFLSTHPNPIDRITEVENLLQQDGIEIKDYTASGNGIFRDEYNINIKNKIR